jgi:hypothetical protein
MTKKNIFLLSLVVVLAGVYVIYFSGWFGTKNIQIMHDVHPARRAVNARTPPQPIISFGFTREYQLTEVKVVAASALATNASALPVWHLSSESNSFPVKMIIYGQFIRGMKPFVANSRPQPLQPNETYRLFVKAGSRTEGEYEFKTPPGQK